MTERGMGDMEIFRPGGLELTQKAAEYIGLRQGHAVLDVGCGLGASLRFLKESFGVEPHGVELSAQTVRRAGETYIVRGDAERLPFPDERFDVVLMECVLPLIREPSAALRESARVLKGGGHLVVSAPGGESVSSLTDRGRVSFDALSEELCRLGFAVLLREDESRLLRRFVAEVIFKYGSLDEYRAEAERTLGGPVLGCDMPKTGTGYELLIARLT